jgi:rhamnosyltransferase subunit B
LRAGTPQLVVPMAFDQFDNGARVAALHAGLTVHATRATVPRVVEMLEKLLQSPEVYMGCTEAKLRVATGEGLGLAIETISKTVSKSRKI